MGGTVRWTNHGQVKHSGSGSGINAGILEPGESAELTFEEPGEFPYTCYLHNDMDGTVTE